MTVTTDLSPSDLATRWREQEAALRAGWGEPGVIPLATMKTMSGMEVFAAIRDGRLPTPPIGRVLDFIAIEFEPGRMVFQGTPTARTTTRSAACTAGTRRRCWTRAWDARSTRCCRPARATRRSS